MDNNEKTTSKPVTLELTTYDNSEVIDHLEDLLKQAKDGEIINIAYIVVYDNNQTSHGFTRQDHVAKTIGALQILNHALLIRAEE